MLKKDRRNQMKLLRTGSSTLSKPTGGRLLKKFPPTHSKARGGRQKPKKICRGGSSFGEKNSSTTMGVERWGEKSGIGGKIGGQKARGGGAYQRKEEGSGYVIWTLTGGKTTKPREEPTRGWILWGKRKRYYFRKLLMGGVGPNGTSKYPVSPQAP